MASPLVRVAVNRGASPRVTHLVPALFGPGGVTGGAERYALELARHMSQQTPTELVTFGADARELTIDGLRVRVLRGRWIRGQRTNPFSARLLAALRGADVIHCHQTHVLSSSLAALFARCTARRVFTTDLGGGGLDVSSYVSTDRWYDGHLHISEYSRRISGHAGKPWAHVILGGVDTVKFSPAETAPGPRPVVFAGRILPHKGLDDLVEGLPAGMALRIIGHAPDPAYLARLRLAAADKQVTFGLDASDDELVAAYRGALCVVLPSVYRTRSGDYSAVPELLGQTLLEGMACGVPGVCTDVASLPEVVEHGVSGFVVPGQDPPALGEALGRLHADPAAARDMGARARARMLERFQWRTVVDRCLSVYAC